MGLVKCTYEFIRKTAHVITDHCGSKNKARNTKYGNMYCHFIIIISKSNSIMTIFITLMH